MEFLKLVFGEHSAGFYLAAILFVLIGQLVNKFITYKKRATDARFDLVYWIKDNWIGLVSVVVVSFVTIRFTAQIISLLEQYVNLDLSYIKDSMFYYFVIGLVYQTIMHWIRKKLTFIRASIDADGQERT